MDILIKLFGEGKDLNALQMSDRGIVMFLIALVLIRISGRRSFGLRMPLDNIISISLGAVMSRAIVGASAFIPVVVCCFVIVFLHRAIGWLAARNKSFSRFIEGDKLLLFEHGKFHHDAMKRGLVCHEDVMQGVRRSALTEELNNIDKIYMERNGEISSVKKQEN
ncbi:DUF421 domain-containing protein [Mucilaginibacter gossypii]|uniref:YetF C-terminal domain-containing protein n=1 Tax=Mucilaginibacter gossypii TaxID=551996 RepID=A0A1G8A0W7_9SPHI|nr:YetF domain-containing protein [Mucilaginibacter gossypii]SDH14100.1 Protein of unknown function [Mucilaginibacter gossypii]